MKSPADILADRLKKKNLTVSVAESCTGGTIGGILTAKPGASSYYLGGAIVYSNHSKEAVLGVSHGNLVEHGAVSREVAREMADGVMSLFCSDLSAAVTGIAGPDGGTPAKPVGTVFIAVADGRDITVSENHFTGDRDSIRRQAAEKAIRMLIDAAE